MPVAENFESRKKFLLDTVGEWNLRRRRTAGSEPSVSEANFFDIVWRDGFNVDQFCLLYFDRFAPELRKRMEDPDERFDRHKIIALTQYVILKTQPLTYTDLRDIDINDVPLRVRQLNVNFAYLFGIQFISRWNEVYYPKSYFCDENQSFDTDIFCTPLNETDAGARFAREHRTYLSSKFSWGFPVFAIANLWFTLEQWGLTHARNQPNWPREK